MSKDATMIVVIWALVLLIALILYYKRTYTVFSRHGVKQFNPLPVLGDMTRVTFKQEHFTDHIERLYNAYPEERFVGRYEFLNPVAVIRDVELVKKITVKDYEHFVDHRTIVSDEADPLFGRNLFSLKGQEWRAMRSTLSPAFTSSKMKLMVPFMVEVGEQMTTALKKKIAESGVGYKDIDCKDLTTRYANDVIASCAFGLKVDSMTEEQNQFYAMGKNASTFNFKQTLKFFAFSSFPNITKYLKLTLLSQGTKSFFRHLVMSTINDRKETHIIRPDMINILMEAKKDWSDDDLIAQAILFFIAGFETESAAMSFLFHEIAMNSDVQERLYQEIKENEAKNGGKFDYNSIQNMVYLDMVVSEALRLWSPGITLDRMCIKDYNMGKPNDKAENDFILRKGMGVAIPIWGLHRDSQYFPNPLKFDPERFSEENKHNIKPFTYVPFGLGPRNCIGSRFALYEVKAMAYQLLQHMELSPCEKTSIPAKLSKESFNILIEGGHWIRIRARH